LIANTPFLEMNLSKKGAFLFSRCKEGVRLNKLVWSMVLNCGGSSIKYKLFNMDNESMIADGNIQGLGKSRGHISFNVSGSKTVDKEMPIADHTAGLQIIIDHFDGLMKNGIIDSLSSLLIVHKIAHGGDKVAPVELITKKVEAAIADMSVVTSVHNPPMLEGIRAMQVIRPNVPQIAVFETGFHTTLPEYASVYGLPYEWAEDYGLRKYGFHGASHRYISEMVPELIGSSATDLRLISIHLGSGTSVAAIKGGRSVDISSGFTPQSGTMMSTRAGDFDPEILYFLLARKILSLEELRDILNNKAGLAGISGIPGGDIRDIQKAAATGNARAKLAMDAFGYNIKKFIGAFGVALQGIDVISFTGGIGENNPQIRAEICDGMEWLGVRLDQAKNDSASGNSIISKIDSPVKVVILPTDEERIVARQAFEFWKKRRK
jgi:acetate kinase